MVIKSKFSLKKIVPKMDSPGPQLFRRYHLEVYTPNISDVIEHFISILYKIAIKYLLCLRNAKVTRRASGPQMLPASGEK